MSHVQALAPRLFAVVALCLAACGDSDDIGVAQVRIQNDFNNPQVTAFQPPWTICESSYQGVEFGKVPIGTTSAPHEVTAGLDYVLMVAAWDDPSCAPAHCLPLATAGQEEVVSGQERTIAVGLTNHRGPCPPEGVPPISQEQYERIRALWPTYNFKPYAERTQNPQCAGSGSDQ